MSEKKSPLETCDEELQSQDIISPELYSPRILISLLASMQFLLGCYLVLQVPNYFGLVLLFSSVPHFVFVRHSNSWNWILSLIGAVAVPCFWCASVYMMSPTIVGLLVFPYVFTVFSALYVGPSILILVQLSWIVTLRLSNPILEDDEKPL